MLGRASRRMTTTNITITRCSTRISVHRDGALVRSWYAEKGKEASDAEVVAHAYAGADPAPGERVAWMHHNPTRFALLRKAEGWWWVSGPGRTGGPAAELLADDRGGWERDKEDDFHTGYEYAIQEIRMVFSSSEPTGTSSYWGRVRRRVTV